MRFLCLILFFYASKVFTAEWQLFFQKGEVVESVGMISIEAKPAMKRFLSSERFDSGCITESCFYDEVRYSISFMAKRMDGFQPPAENSFLKIKSHNSDKLIQCNNVSEWEKHSLKKVVTNFPDAFKVRVQYEKKTGQWKQITEDGYSYMPLADTTDGHSLLQFMDLVVMSGKRSAEIPVLQFEADPIRPKKTGTLERKKCSSLEALSQSFIQVWRNNFFDPVFGTDCTWDIRIAIYENSVTIQLSDSSTSETYWLVYTSCSGSQCSDGCKTNKITNLTITESLLSKRKRYFLPFLINSHTLLRSKTPL